jgi:hypothetical protein
VANYIQICAAKPHHAEPPLTWPVHHLGTLGMQSLLFGDKNLVVLATPVVIISDAHMCGIYRRRGAYSNLTKVPQT